MTAVAVIDMDIRSPESSEWSDRVERVDCYALGSTELDRYAVLIITSTVDRRPSTRSTWPGIGPCSAASSMAAAW